EHRRQDEDELFGPQAEPFQEFVHDVTSRTSLPNCVPAASRRKAAAPSASGITASTTGRNAGSAASRAASANSAALPIVEPSSDHWYQKSLRTSVVTIGPDVPPHVTSRPPRPSERSDACQVASPTLSTTTSA